MTDHETDPQRSPAPADAEPSHPTAELPHAESGHPDSTVTPAAAPVPADSPAAGTPAAAEAGRTDTPAADTVRFEPVADAGRTDTPAADTVRFEAPVADAGRSEAPAGDAGRFAAPAAPASPYAPSYPGSGQPQQPSPWAGGQQQGGWAAGVHQTGPAYAPHGGPVPPYQQHQPYPGAQPHQAGQPVPPWGAPQPAPRPSRAGKFIGAGALALALMLGSGVAGGALALAVSDGSGTTINRTYSAAPVINSADLPKIAAAVQDSVVSIMTDSGEGSGVILSADGYVLTNNHVVASASGDTVKVVFADGKTAQAKIVGTDPKTDLAVVKASGVSDLKAAKFGDSDAMQVGDQVLALGSPLGLQGSVTAGILSARDRTIQAGESGQQMDPRQAASSISGLLQTDAPINPGNSGGALVNTRGEVIGINTAIATAGQGSNGNIGVGFAIPSNKAKDVAEKLQRGEKVSHPSLGVSVNAAEDGGAMVASVTAGSAAEKAGIQRGDVITKFGDKVINDSNDLVGAVQAGKVGDRVQVEFKRNGSAQQTTVTLAES
ncbi:trypsin-like peptidase domain-containing protein [Micromonospora sp. DR5-3]|uniref:trypsin-like peptidase domain-containing protein n=1 Tax=unclassified Micromonospora TaxID=2617518 RepID=UPI0011D2F1E9|nr:MULTISPECIES: trypsin-like peptidase domain-containing protein [unclassified Micromonospora]MCW3814827.1 trypsin-like peptidase domain-containing protein [Micromonospora sp. DR5-3]TYC24149.1 PDZ domain-containing protein [Micromonospora sp. MP36]